MRVGDNFFQRSQRMGAAALCLTKKISPMPRYRYTNYQRFLKNIKKHVLPSLDINAQVIPRIIRSYDFSKFSFLATSPSKLIT